MEVSHFVFVTYQEKLGPGDPRPWVVEGTSFYPRTPTAMVHDGAWIELVVM